MLGGQPNQGWQTSAKQTHVFTLRIMSVLPFFKYTYKSSCLLHNYFTIPGYDYTGRSSSAKSEGIVIDTTAPFKSNLEITIGARYITDLSYVEAWYA